jgi:hypothetical protein
MSKTIDLIIKIKALADRGEGGEKLNATKILQDLMAKHNITFDDIDGEKKDYEIFEYSRNKHQILHQVMLMIMGKGLKIYGYKGKRNAMVIECTKSQYLEIQAAFAFYWAAYERDLEIFTNAFIHKNRLIPHDADEINLKEMSEDQIRELKKTLGMMAVIERRTMNKALVSSSTK